MTRTRTKVMSKGLMGIFGAGAVGLLVLCTAALASGTDRTADGGRSGQAVRSEAKGAQEPLAAILKDLENYSFAEGVGAPMRLRAHVHARKDDPRARREIEDRLLAFLRSDAWPGGKMEVCRALRLIGSAASVPVLEGMLANRDTTDMARFALERIPGEEADRALVAAVEKTTGDIRRGIIATLGARGTGAAVGPLARLAADKDEATALDATRALGAIGTPEAAAALTAVLARARGALAAEAASALLLLADRDLVAGRKPSAVGIYEKVFSARVPAAARRAAYRGRIAAAGERGRDLILKALAGKDAALYGPAIAMVPAVFEAGGLGPVIGSMAGLPAEAKVQLVSVLGGYRGEAVKSAVLEALRSPLPQVRIEALRSLGRIGDASAVGDLVAHAATAVGQEQSLAREVLSKLPGPEVDGAVVERLAIEKDDAIRAELVRAAGSRRIAGAKPALVEAVGSAPPAIRARAAAALKDVASPADIPVLLDALIEMGDETGREELRTTVAAVAMRIPRPSVRANAVKARLAGEKDPRRKADLLGVLGKIGEDGSLAFFRQAVYDADEGVVDAAVRALVDWPTPTARDDVYEIARTSGSLTHRVLALRAYVRMIGLEPHRSPDGATADLFKALALAARPEERKLVLAVLARFPCVASLKTAESLQADPAVAAEAKLAADRIRQSLK